MDLPKRDNDRIDYTTARKAPVLTIFIRFNKKILLLKRSQEVLTYKGKWNTVAGYLDQLKPLEEKVKEELFEELSLDEKDIESYYLGSSYSFDDNEIQKTWIIFPVLVELKHKPRITLDWEHTEYKWIYPEEIDQYDTVPNAKKSLQYVLETLK